MFEVVEKTLSTENGTNSFEPKMEKEKEYEESEKKGENEQNKKGRTNKK